MLGSALLLLAAALLAVPGAFVGARGVSGLRRGFVIVRGAEVRGAKARVVAVALVGYGAVMIALALAVAARALRGMGA
ncbi:MAG TPA: hypothetical protein VLS93_03015 [Anaeromyxobacteraceae bacterium]|nr:hypothetical protein [Anaeromyxobacteraceae bacterium]